MSDTARPRLLVLTSSFPRWDNDTDPRFVADLCFELAANFDVTVLAPHCRGAMARETLLSGERAVGVHRYRYAPAIFESLTYEGGIAARLRGNPLRALLIPLLLLAQLVAAMRLHRQTGYAAVHAHWVIPQGLVAMLWRTLSRRAPPVLLTAHGSDIGTLQGPLLDRLKRRILRSVCRVSVVSGALKNDCAALGADTDKIRVRSMGVDLRSTFTPPAEEGSDLLYVGKLVANKGVDHLLHALAELREQRPALRLTVVGDGEAREDLQALCTRLGLAEAVEFAGSQPHVRLPGYYREAAIVVMPSLREGFGLVIVEAMGCRCAVVASDLPAIRDIVSHEETGLLAKAGDPHDLAAQVGRLLDDAGLRRQLAANGRQRALERFDWASVGRDYGDLIAAMIDERAG